MKNKSRLLTGIAVLAVLFGIQAQVICQAQDAVPQAVQSLPSTGGTFYVLQNMPAGGRATAGSRMLAPYPGLPPGGGIVYQVSQYRSDIYLVDQRTQPQIDADLLSALVTLRIRIAAAFANPAEGASGEMSLMSQDGPPLPGEGEGGTNSGGGTYELDGPVYGDNLIWMEVGLTNTGSASLLNIVIHPPTWDTNLIYDVMLTTNMTLATPEGALNRTNWFYLGKTQPGQTNIQVDMSVWPGMGFIQLANAALDPDGDGISTGVELSCAHSNPAMWDTDNDGLSDGWEFFNGLNPTVDDSAQTGSRANFNYDSSGWLRYVTGARSESMTVDNEGNVSQ